MKVRDCMSPNVQTISPDETIEMAAKSMAQHDFGSLPVANANRLVGMITDRDIAVRGVGEGRAPSTKVSEIMTDEVLYCEADVEVEDALGNMGDIQVRRLPVVDGDKNLVGILSISDAASREKGTGAEALVQITRPSQQHSQQP